MTSLDTISSAIQNMLDSTKIPCPTLPAWMLWCVSVKRPGFSINRAVSELTAKNQACGIDTTTHADGRPNLLTQFGYNVIDSAFNEIKNNGVVEIAIRPGSIIMADGSTNVNFGSATGIIR